MPSSPPRTGIRGGLPLADVVAAVAIWVCQFVGQKINVLDYYEAQGQELSVHLAWLRSRGWGKA